MREDVLSAAGDPLDGPWLGDVHRYRGRGPERPLTSPTTITRRLRRWAATRPHDPWLVAVAADGGTTTLTWGLAEHHSARLACWLSTTVGITPDSAVAVLPTNDVPSALTVLALLRLRCAVLFVGPDEPPARRAELLASTALAAVLAPTADVADRVPAALRVPDPDTLAGDDLDTRPTGRTGGRLLFGTSGSTAASKIVVQSEYAATVNAEALRRHHGLRPGIRVLGCLPVHHVNGLHFTLLATLWAGAQAVLLEAFRPDLYVRCLQRHRPAVASVVPTILERLLAGAPVELPVEFRYFVSAAAPLPARTSERVATVLGARVLQGYGLTETTNFSTTMPPWLAPADHRSLSADADIPSVGSAMFGNDVTVLRPDGTPAAEGETGEVCMRGHNVMLGYLDPTATAEAFAGGWFRSGDLGHHIRGPRGRTFFFLTGRAKNMAKVTGITVSLEEMERVLRMLPEVTDAVCFTEPERFRGERIVAVVATERPLLRRDLDDHLRQYFTAPCLPSRFVYSTEVPRTMTGKVIRSQLAAMFGDTSAGVTGGRS